MKKLFCFALMLSLVQNIYAQKPLKIAYVRKHNDSGVLLEERDSTAYFYDKNNILRTAINYFKENNLAIWEKVDMIMYPEGEPNVNTQIYFTWDKVKNVWMKQKKVIATTTENPHTQSIETANWNVNQNAWKNYVIEVEVNDSLPNHKLTQEWKGIWADDKWLKYTESIENVIYENGKKIRCEKKNCTACGLWDETREESKQEFKYDSNDSLISILSYFKKFDTTAFALTDKILYEYKREGEFDIKQTETTIYAANRDPNYTKYIVRLFQGKAVSERIFTVVNGGIKLSSIDTITYDINENQTIHEWQSFGESGEIVYKGRSRTGYKDGNIIFTETINMNSLDEITYAQQKHSTFKDGIKTEDEYRHWNSITGEWQKYNKIITVYDNNRLRSAYEYYYWIDSVNAWKFQKANYINYNSFENVTEVGIYYGDTEDSLWTQRFYYQEAVPKYHALNGDLSFVLSPNPSNGHVNANIYTEEPDDLHIVMVDMFGRFVFEKKWHVSIGVSQIKLLGDNQLRSGAYLYYLSNKNSEIVRKGKLIITK